MHVAQLTMSTLAGLALRATVMMLLAWVGALCLRGAPAAVRHLVWATAIAGALVIPAFAGVGRVRLAILPSLAVPAQHVEPAANATMMGSLPIQSIVDVRPSDVGLNGPAETTRGPALSVWSIALDIWLAVTVVIVAWLLVGLRSIRGVLACTHTIDSPEWRDALTAACAGLGVTEMPRLVVSDRVEMAFACNAFRPTIVLPRASDEWTAERRRAVLLHEVAHIRRRDLIGHAAAAAACAVYWFNPLVWLAAARLRVESELACDDLVLGAGVRASDYAEHLLHLVTALAGRPGAPSRALAMARGKGFEDRLHAILDPERSRAAYGRLRSFVILGGVGLLAIATAAVAPVRRASAVPHSIASSVVSAAGGSTGLMSELRKLSSAADRVEERPAQVQVGAHTNDTSLAAMVAAYLRSAVPPAIERERILSVLHSGRTDPGSKATATTVEQLVLAGILNPASAILRASDSIGLSAAQTDSIGALNRNLTLKEAAIGEQFALYVAALPDALDDDDAYAHYRAGRRAMIHLLRQVAPEIRSMLTAEQRQKLPAMVTPWLDSGFLDFLALFEASGPRPGPGPSPGAAAPAVMGTSASTVGDALVAAVSRDTGTIRYFSGSLEPLPPALRDSMLAGPPDQSITVFGDVALVMTPGQPTRPYTGDEISADSARALLGPALFLGLRLMVGHASDGVIATEEDWALPPRHVTAVGSGDALGTGPRVTNGLIWSVSAGPGDPPLGAKALQSFLDETHMNPAADYLVDDVPSTPAHALAVLDSGLVTSITVVKPRNLAEGAYNACCVPPINGAIKLTTKR